MINLYTIGAFILGVLLSGIVMRTLSAAKSKVAG